MQNISVCQLTALTMNMDALRPTFEHSVVINNKYIKGFQAYLATANPVINRNPCKITWADLHVFYKFYWKMKVDERGSGVVKTDKFWIQTVR